MAHTIKRQAYAIAGNSDMPQVADYSEPTLATETITAKKRSIEARLPHTVVTNHQTVSRHSSSPILGTIRVNVFNGTLKMGDMRCLCDTGSDVNLITSETVARLNLKVARGQLMLTTFGDISTHISRGRVHIKNCPNHGRINDSIRNTVCHCGQRIN